MWSWGPPPGEAQPFKGMVYGMNTRMPSGPGPAVTSGLWSVWDAFGIAAARMVGYWSPRPAVSVHATATAATATATASEQQQQQQRWRPGAADTRGGGQPGSLGVLATAYVLRGANNDSDDTNNTTNRTLIAAASWNSTTTVASRRAVA